MELELLTNTQPGSFEITNFETLKRELTEYLTQYQNVVIVEDEDRLKELQELINLVESMGDIKAGITLYKDKLIESGLYIDDTTYAKPYSLSDSKKLKATLNNAAKAFNDRRIQIEKEYMKPFNVGKNQVKELIELLNDVSNKINTGVSAFDDKYQNAKKQVIQDKFISLNDIEWLTLEKIWNEKWLNKSYKEQAIESEIKEKIASIKNDLTALSIMANDDKPYLNVMIIEYQDTLNLSMAITSGNSYKRNLEHLKNEETFEQKVAKQDKEYIEENETLYTVSLRVRASKQKMAFLSDFLKANKYLFKMEIKND